MGRRSHAGVPEAEEGTGVRREGRAAEITAEVVPLRARVGESAGGDGDEGHQKPAEAAEPPGDRRSGGFREVELRPKQAVEIAPVAELQGGGERRRGGAAELRLARVMEVWEWGMNGERKC